MRQTDGDGRLEGRIGRWQLMRWTAEDGGLESEVGERRRWNEGQLRERNMLERWSNGREGFQEGADHGMGN